MIPLVPAAHDCSIDPKNISALAHAPTPGISFKLRAFIYNSMFKKKSATVRLVGRRRAVRDVTKKRKGGKKNTRLACIYASYESQARLRAKSRLENSEFALRPSLSPSRSSSSRFLSRRHFPIILPSSVLRADPPPRRILFSFIPLSSPLNFSRSYLLSLFPPVHSSFRVPSLFSLLYYSLPLVAPLFILARGELRDDNGKSKGFVWGAGGREG